MPFYEFLDVTLAVYFFMLCLVGFSLFSNGLAQEIIRRPYPGFFPAQCFIGIIIIIISALSTQYFSDVAEKEMPGETTKVHRCDL